MDLNHFIDHTLLKSEATESDIIKLCDEARRFSFYSVMINPVFVSLAADKLAGTDIKVGAVAGFPLGANQAEIKIMEAVRAEKDGASEIDIVANLGWMMAGRWDRVTGELRDIKQHLSRQTVLKIIIEMPLIPDSLWPYAVEAVISAGADFVKSGTGFFGPVTIDQVVKLSALSYGRIKIKAAGGIKTAAGARGLISAGANRIGCSASVAIMQEYLVAGKK
jgi:deoxyribose-phosphate aldolase